MDTFIKKTGSTENDPQIIFTSKYKDVPPKSIGSISQEIYEKREALLKAAMRKPQSLKTL